MPDTVKNTRKQSASSSIVLDNPQDVARYFCYVEKLAKLSFSKEEESSKPIVLYKNISAKLVYSKNKKVFDKLFETFLKYEIDMKSYLGFFVFELGKTRKELNEILTMDTLNKYVMRMELLGQYRKICSYLEKSIKNIVDKCLEMGYSDCRQYLAVLAKNNKLGEKYITGEISQYYLAAIKNIDKLIGEMDCLNKDELEIFIERKEKLNSDAQIAYSTINHEHFNPITLTNNAIGSKQNQN